MSLSVCLSVEQKRLKTHSGERHLHFMWGCTWHNSGGSVCLSLCLSVDLFVFLFGHSSIHAGRHKGFQGIVCPRKSTSVRRHGGFKGLYVQESVRLCTCLGGAKGLFGLESRLMCPGMGVFRDCGSSRGDFCAQAFGFRGLWVLERRLLCTGMFFFRGFVCPGEWTFAHKHPFAVLRELPGFPQRSGGDSCGCQG